MKTRKLGDSGLEVGPLAIGGNVFGRTIDEPTSFRRLEPAPTSSTSGSKQRGSN